MVGGGAGLWHYAPIRKLIISHSSCAQAARPLQPLSLSSSDAGKMANHLMAQQGEGRLNSWRQSFVVLYLTWTLRYIFKGSSGILDEVKQWSKFLELRWPDHCTADPEILNLVDGYRCHIHISLIYILNKPGILTITVSLQRARCWGAVFILGNVKMDSYLFSICISTEGSSVFILPT